MCCLSMRVFRKEETILAGARKTRSRVECLLSGARATNMKERVLKRKRLND